ncbi:MAG: GyrI-like domain-containing protein [Bacteroidales bacterium]|nr:GyrI-like domain-containing protein [Bacteroidales bacterium]MBN2820550.1 GyrI-like domain-containing protein [Bacteroidales bacterium]
MKKQFLSICLTLLTTVIMAQNSTQTAFKVEEKQMDAITMVYYNYTGAYMHSFDEFGQLMGYIQQNQIPMGSYTLGVFYDDPATVSEAQLRSEAGFMVAKQVDVSGKYKCKTIPAGKVVSVRYKSMDEIMAAYEALSKYIAEKQLKTKEFSVEIYYSADPSVVDAEVLMYIEG